MDEDRRSVEAGGSDHLKVDSPRPSVPADDGALPASLRERLDRCAESWLSDQDRIDGFAAGARGSQTSRWLPWGVAGVALAIAAAAWLPSLYDPVPGSAPVSQWQLRWARDRMLAEGPRTGHWRWAGDASGTGSGTGDVAWDNERQRGFLLLRGFVPNDPARARYQLWILDAGRDDRYPVDGGVFDIPADAAEVVVPFRPALPVLRPIAFVVTVEGPRGAVVSERDKIVAYAPAGG